MTEHDPFELGDLEQIDNPFPDFHGIVVRVRGNEMFPRYQDGDLLLFHSNSESPDSLLGKEAIVETEDGRLLLKVLHRGSEPGVYVLVSSNPMIPPLVNVRLKAVSRIEWHKYGGTP